MNDKIEELENVIQKALAEEDEFLLATKEMVASCNKRVGCLKDTLRKLRSIQNSLP